MTDRLGLVGGLAVNAGIFYYQELVARFQAQHGHVEILLVHANLRAVLSLVSSGDTDGLAAYLSEIVIRLSQAGCGSFQFEWDRACARFIVRLHDFMRA